jgi:hypothetical protein
MSTMSANLALPYLAPSQAQKHITHNEALRILDSVVQLAVVSQDQTAPPAQPPEGARYIVGPSPSGLWAGQGDQLAVWAAGGWIFISPQDGWRARVLATRRDVIWQDSSWQGVADLDMLSGLGINATFDATNSLAVASPATLFTHEGAGHQLKINKAAAGETGSLLFQSNWSGRAEMGLAGSDAWSIKVTADGSNWTEALSFDPATGLASGAAVQDTPGAAQAGQLLTTGAFGLGERGISVTPTQLETLAATGFYTLAGVIPNHLDSGSHVIHSQGRGNEAVQIGFLRNAHIVKWRRYIVGAWTDWQEIFSQARVVGAVAQIGGLPTGAIIEQDSNANGSYVRFADGTQICRQHQNHDDVVFTGSNSLELSRNFIPSNWPAAFASGTTVDVTSDFRGLNTTAVWGSSAGSNTLTAPCGSYRFVRVAGSSTPNCQASFIGMGRWY